MPLKDQIVAAFAKPALHPLLDRFIGYALRLKGYNNYPPEGGALGDLGEKRFIETHLAGTARTCLDIGGNRGEFTESLLTLTSARTVCVEPNPDMARLAQERNQRFRERFILVEKAISDRNGVATLNFDPVQTKTATLSSEVTKHAYPGQKTVQVQVVTIDQLVADLQLDSLDFIKIDVEGLELACLDGAQRTLETLKPRYVQVEMHWHHIFTGTTVFAISERLPGYRACRLLPKGLAPVNPRTTLDNIFAYSNLIFVR